MELNAQTKTGLFLSFEGLDGCGKTTQIKLLKKAYEALGRDVEIFREPGCTSLGESVREILLHTDFNIGERAELLLYLSSRSQVTDEIVFPALKNGKVLIADRYADSSIAYQGFGRQIGAQRVKMLNDFAVRDKYPDITFLLDITVEKALKRIKNKEPDRLEKENDMFFQRVHEGYEWLLTQNRERFVKIQGELSPEQVHEAIKRELNLRELL